MLANFLIFFEGITQNATEELFRSTAAQRQSQGQTQLGLPKVNASIPVGS